MLLALDTSTRLASVALASEGRLLAELTWEVGQRHSAELFDRLDWLLSSAGVEPRALEGIAVATGPGSFNGLRVALTTAKTLAYSLEVPLYGHTTLDVIGWGHASSATPIWALLEAGRGQVYAACYLPAATAVGWAPVGGRDGYAILTPDELAGQVEGPALIAGELRPETCAVLAVALCERAQFAAHLASRGASWLAELALERAAGGVADDPMTLEPLYLRKPAITQSSKTNRANAMTAPHDEAQSAQTATASASDTPDRWREPGREGVRRAIRH